VASHDGAGLFIRQYLLYGKAWQRAGIVLTLVLVGATLLALGYLTGAVPAVLGVVLGVRIWGPTPLRASEFRRADRRTRGPIMRRSEPPDPLEDR
jgi:hypothetical protein